MDKALRRKVDLRILPLVSTLYLLSFLDRVNVANTHISLKKVIGISEAEYSWIVGIFFIGYVLFEIPSNLMLKKATPSKWIARIMVSWGFMSVLMAFCTSYYSLLVCRFFLGVAEAGFFPGMVLYLTFWYPSQDRALRIALIYCSAAIAGGFSGMLAYLILNGMDGFLSLHGYQWIFIIEGSPSIFAGIATWFLLPDFPSTSSFLSDTEKELIEQELENDRIKVKGTLPETNLVEPLSNSNSVENLIESTTIDPSIKSLEPNFWDDVAKIVNWKALKMTLLSPRILTFAILYLCLLIPFYSVAFFLPTFLSKMGLNEIDSNLLTVPIYFLATLSTLFGSFQSGIIYYVQILITALDRLKIRSPFLIVCCIVSIFGYIGLLVWGTPESIVQPHTKPTISEMFHSKNFVLAYLFTMISVASIYPTIAIVMAWLTESLNRPISKSKIIDHNSDAVQSTKMASGTALVVAFGNLGGIIGPQIYAHGLSDDGSYFYAHLSMIFSLLGVIILAFGIRRMESVPEN